MAEGRRATSRSLWLVTAEDGVNALSLFTLEGRHAKRRRALKLSLDFVIHSLRRTLGTRLGELGADAFTIMQIMGHSTVTVSRRYVHSTPDSLERAFERLGQLNQRATLALSGAMTPARVPAISTTASSASNGVVQ